MSKLIERIKAKLQKKDKILIPPPVPEEIGEDIPIVQEPEIEEEPVPEDVEPIPDRVIIKWKGKSKPLEPDPEEAETEEAVYVCELCQPNYLHVLDDMVQCQKCDEWFCQDHIAWHVKKQHRVI